MAENHSRLNGHEPGDFRKKFKVTFAIVSIMLAILINEDVASSGNQGR